MAWGHGSGRIAIETVPILGAGTSHAGTGSVGGVAARPTAVAVECSLGMWGLGLRGRGGLAWVAQQRTRCDHLGCP